MGGVRVNYPESTPKIEIGQYTGNGGTTEIKFNFPAKFILISYLASRSVTASCFVPGSDIYTSTGSVCGGMNESKIWLNKDSNLNGNGTKFVYMVIG